MDRWKDTNPFDDLQSRSTTFVLCVLWPLYRVFGDAVCQVAVRPSPEWSSTKDKFVYADT